MTGTIRIRCAICNKPVDTIDMEFAPDKASYRITVGCHGDFDAMMLGLDFIRLTNRETLDDLAHQEGVAFTTPRISG